jgi:hypothetical protein
VTVRIGKIELIGVQELYTEEARTLVEQRVPEQQGSVFQDLGREPVTILLEGLLIGDGVMGALEDLRASQAKAEPLPFVADVAVGTELTDVVIEDLRVRQVAGYRHRYRYSIRLREHMAPPQPAGAALTPVNAGIEADAAVWGQGAIAAAAVLQDPVSLGEALAANPDLLEHLDMSDLGTSMTASTGDLSGAQLSGILQAIGERDPSAAMVLFQGLKDAGGLGALLGKLADEGLPLPEFLQNLDPKLFSDLARFFAGGLDFLKKLKEVSDKARTLADRVKGFDPLAPIRPLLE